MASTKTSTITVLIVEDEPVTRRGLELFIQRLPGIDVVGIVTSGEEALLKANELRPDLVLMDIGLPGIDGIDAAAKIKSENPSQRVLMLTVDSSAEAVFAAFDAGADGYVLKSSFAYSLELAIRTVRCGSVWLDPQIAQTILRMAVASSGQAGKPFSLSRQEETVLMDVASTDNCENGVCFVQPSFVAELKRFRAQQGRA